MFPYVGNNLSPTPWKHLPFKNCPPASLSSGQTAHLYITIWFCNNPALSIRTGGQPPRPAPQAEATRKNPRWTFRSRRLIGICLEDLCKGGSKCPQKSTVLFQCNSKMGRDRKTQTDVKCHVNHPLPPPLPLRDSYVPNGVVGREG